MAAARATQLERGCPNPFSTASAVKDEHWTTGDVTVSSDGDASPRHRDSAAETRRAAARHNQMCGTQTAQFGHLKLAVVGAPLKDVDGSCVATAVCGLRGTHREHITAHVQGCAEVVAGLRVATQDRPTPLPTLISEAM